MTLVSKKFYLLPRFDPGMLADPDFMVVAFGTVTEEEAERLMARDDLIRRGFGEEVELEPGDTGLIKDARGRWTMFRVGLIVIRREGEDDGSNGGAADR